MSDAAADVDALCDALVAFLDGGQRRVVVDRVTRSGGMADALRRLRSSMSSHGFEGLPRDIAGTIRHLDRRTRRDGFRVLHSWNHATHEFTDDLTPVLLVDFFERVVPEDSDPHTRIAILLDHYVLHLLALLAMRAWDTEDPDATLDRVGRLLELLQGPDGSGHRFVGGAETLLILALSQFHPEEHAYDRMIERVDRLAPDRRVRFARVSAAVLGAHLRWGFWLMYERDVGRMRDDNVGDYPWLLWSVTTLLRACAEPDRDDAHGLAGSLLLGLAADPWAFAGRPPAALGAFADMHAECRTLLETHGARLLDEVETHRPTKTDYAPLSFVFNFPHNALVAAVTLALLEGRPRTLALDDLFVQTGTTLRSGDTTEEVEPSRTESAAKEAFARDLMAFSGGSPDRLGYRGAMLVAYDPLTGLRTFSMVGKALRESLAPS